MTDWTILFLGQTLHMQASSIADVRQQIRDLEGIPPRYLAVDADPRRRVATVKLQKFRPVHPVVMEEAQELAAIARRFFADRPGVTFMDLDSDSWGHEELSMGEYVALRAFLHASNVQVTDDVESCVEESCEAVDGEAARERPRSR